LVLGALGGNKYRFFAYALNNATFTGNTGAAARLLCFVNQAGAYVLTPQNALIGDAAGRNILSGSISGTLTINQPLPPTISFFTPTNGPVGTPVVITGTNFTGATQVTFNGIVASPFTIDSDIQISTTVPTGAATGKISVTTPAGTAASTNDFTVIPSLLINDVTVTEGNSGTANAVFTVTLSAASSQQITVDYATANGTATAGNDYVAISTTPLIFLANTTTQTITVAVNGDLLDEVDETFFVNLTNPSNATIADEQGVGTITDDDAAPSISINDVTIAEGNTGTANAVLTVSLSAASGQIVTVDYATANGTATAGSDYVAIPTTLLTFPANTTTQTITVIVNGDVTNEPNETFFVNLSNPNNASIADAQSVGTISNDDVTLVTIILNPTDDAYVRSDQTSSNFGTATTLRMKQSSPIYNSYLKFVVSTVNGTVQSAKLRMKVTVASSSGGSVYTVSNNQKGNSTPWTQSNLKYSNAPSISGAPLSTVGSVTVNQMVEFDVTSAVTGNNTYSFGLNNASTTTVQYSSKEGATKPELVIQFVPQPPVITSLPWTQSNLNYSNAPIISGTPLFTVGSVTVGQVVEFDVTPAITGNGTFSFGLNNASTMAVQYSSKEGATKPELVIQTSTTATKIAGLAGDAVELKTAETMTTLPAEFSLSANYPNPFNAQTVIEYALPEAAQVRLVIFNVLGQRIRQLVDENAAPGYKRIVWDGRNELGVEVGSGIYFLQMNAGRQKFVRKMFLQR